MEVELILLIFPGLVEAPGYYDSGNHPELAHPDYVRMIG
jgi:hypothetical protein